MPFIIIHSSVTKAATCWCVKWDVESGAYEQFGLDAFSGDAIDKYGWQKEFN